MGNLDWVGDYRLHLRLVSDDPKRSEHGFHVHAMKGNKTFAKIDLDTQKLIGDKDSDMTRSELRAILNYIEEHYNELVNKAKHMRNK